MAVGGRCERWTQPQAMEDRARIDDSATIPGAGFTETVEPPPATAGAGSKERMPTYTRNVGNHEAQIARQPPAFGKNGGLEQGEVLAIPSFPPGQFGRFPMIFALGLDTEGPFVDDTIDTMNGGDRIELAQPGDEHCQFVIVNRTRAEQASRLPHPPVEFRPPVSRAIGTRIPGTNEQAGPQCGDNTQEPSAAARIIQRLDPS